MRLILLGPPGSGKGTQAKLLSQRLGPGAHLAPATSCARPIRQGHARRPARPAVHARPASSSPTTWSTTSSTTRFRRDGPARRASSWTATRARVPQANSFDHVLAEQGLDLDAVVFLKVADEEIVRRLGGRWSCPNPTCKATYHERVQAAPAVAGSATCAARRCVQRDDDKPATIRQRLEVFHSHNDELVEHYRKRRACCSRCRAGRHRDDLQQHCGLAQGLQIRREFGSLTACEVCTPL